MEITLLLAYGHAMTLTDVSEESLRALLLPDVPTLPKAVEHADGVAYVTPSQIVAVET